MLTTVETCLRGWVDQIESKISELNEEILRIKRQIDSIYDEDATLRNVRYNLHSVCIHEGNAMSGHFWTYIWKPEVGKWFKFNDVEVSESTWEDLYMNAVGGSTRQSTTTGVATQEETPCGQNNLSKTTNDKPVVNQQQSQNMMMMTSIVEETNSTFTTSASSQSTINTTSKLPTNNNEKIPSAYFLIYTKADDDSLYQGIYRKFDFVKLFFGLIDVKLMKKMIMNSMPI